MIPTTNYNTNTYVLFIVIQNTYILFIRTLWLISLSVQFFLNNGLTVNNTLLLDSVQGICVENILIICFLYFFTTINYAILIKT